MNQPQTNPGSVLNLEEYSVHDELGYGDEEQDGVIESETQQPSEFEESIHPEEDLDDLGKLVEEARSKVNSNRKRRT